jgi:hypothetical protein
VLLTRASPLEELCLSYKTLFFGADEKENAEAAAELTSFATSIFGDFFTAMQEALSGITEAPPDLLKVLPLHL